MPAVWKLHNLTAMKILLLAGLALVGATASLHGQSPTTRPELRPGDTVKITVWQRPEMSGEFQVAQDGTLLHPLYREVVVTGIPIDQVTERVRTYLRRLEADPQVVIEPLITVAVLGAVRQPSVYKLAVGTTLEGAVIAAGGPAVDAKPEDSRLVRDGRERDVDLSPGSSNLQMLVLSGDQVTIKVSSPGGFQRVFLPTVQTIGAIASIIRLITWRR